MWIFMLPHPLSHPSRTCVKVSGASKDRIVPQHLLVLKKVTLKSPHWGGKDIDHRRNNLNGYPGHVRCTPGLQEVVPIPSRGGPGGCRNRQSHRTQRWFQVEAQTKRPGYRNLSQGATDANCEGARVSLWSASQRVILRQPFRHTRRRHEQRHLNFLCARRWSNRKSLIWLGRNVERQVEKQLLFWARNPKSENSQ